MRRDMELVRKILLEISKGDVKSEFGENDDDRIYMYHMEILKEAGLIQYTSHTDFSRTTYFSSDPKLTWEGNDYLDAISNDTVWNKAKTSIKNKGIELGEIPFSVLKTFLADITKEILGLK